MAAPLDNLPLWSLFLATIVLMYSAVEAGYALGNYRRSVSVTEKEATIGPIVGATLGLLAFILAFTFGLAASHFDARRQMVVEEANAIGTAHLRAGFLSESHRLAVRNLLAAYVSTRLDAVRTGNVKQAMAESVALHNRLWAYAEAAATEEPRSIPVGLFIQSLNEMIDLHAQRILVGVRSRIPASIWEAVYLVSMLAMAEIGYNIGLAGSRRSWAALALVLTFSIVMLLIVDLDRPQDGMLRVSQEAMLDLQQAIAPAADHSQTEPERK